MIDLVLQADEEIVAAYASFHQEPGRIVSETRLPDFRGRGETWLWNTASVLNDDEGEVIGAIQSIRDITVQKKREQDLETALTLQRQAEEAGRLMAAQFHQAQKMEAIGRLAGGIAHDFNNMLNVILGQAQLVALKLGKETPAAANIEEITKAAQRSAELIRQLLGYARKQIINPQIVDVNEAAENLLKMLRRLIGEDIDLVWKPYGHLWPVKIDPSQFNQLLTNLTVNARDAISGQGLITIETDNVQFDARYCETHLGFAVGDYVLLAVSDNGCGMNKEVMDRLFEPFFTTKPKGVGTGLGLATVYGVVKQNGGFINVYSEPGRGSTFKIYLPRDQESPASRPCPPSLPCLPTGKETILLVEDEESLLEIGEEMLRHLGYRVLPASGPRRALAMLQDSPEDIHLVITDVVMPEMNGKELVDRISALRPGLKFLYMSGYTANAIVHRGILDEGLNFIQKPFSLEEMASKVRAVLDGPVKIPS
jgi:signal transduction histidine kinase/CheY-like chemotaxis protein